MGAIFAVAAGVAAGSLMVPSTPAPIDPAVDALSDQRLAASVLFGCTDSRATAYQRRMARTGVSGIALLGDRPPRDLRQRLARVHGAAPDAVVIASDEEGGTVQRLAPLLGSLPSAATMGRWPSRRIERTAANYARRMAALGVDMSLAPVADLNVPGNYIATLGRAFSGNPRAAGRDVVAWSRGTAAAGVLPVVKHWPGHGHAGDTHERAARVPRLSVLERRDMVPFRMALAAGVPVVMVGHLQAKGLTRRGVPASQSRPALRLLRDQAGPDTVIVTDSLSMAASSSARGLSESQAVVAALRAGVDWAMVCTEQMPRVVSAVTRAIRSGRLNRAALEVSATRIRTLQR